MLLQLTLSVLAVLAIIYVVPVVMYGASSRFVEMPSPENVGPARFLTGVLVTKLGTAVAFVAIFWLARDVWAEQWFVYAAIWFIMFAASEVGDAVSGRSSIAESVVGIASEAVYAPAAAWVVFVMLT